MQGKTKNKHILVQSAVIIAVLFGLFMLINSIATYINFYDLSIADIKIYSDHTKDLARDVFQEYSSLPWLLDYWQKNCKTLDVSHTRNNWEKYDVLPKEILLHKAEITPEQAEAFSPEIQHLFAELCYREIASVLDVLAENQNLHTLYLVKMLEDRDAFVFYYKGFDNTVLGDIFPFNIEKHPLIKNMYSTGVDPAEFEVMQVDDYYKDGRTAELFYNYALLKADNNNLCHLVACFLGSDVRKAIFSELLDVAGINIICFISLGVVLLLAINAFLLRPLRTIQEDVKDYIDNKDSEVIVSRLREVKSQNEIGRLADDISSLAVELEHYTAEKARMDAELSLAATIQDGALPKDFPDLKEFKLFALLKPAKEVGGDLYDFFMIDDDHIALIIGDVSGKGISAALFMMKVKTLLKYTALSNRGLSLGEIAAKVNQVLYDSNEAMMFVTLWFGIMTISTGELVSINAGHEYPVIRYGTEPFKLLQTRHSGPLGISLKTKFSEEKLVLKPGDTFFIYTDGLAEANNKDEEQFGLDRIVEALNEHPDYDPKGLTEFLLGRLDDFVGEAPQFDDTTILCLKMQAGS